MASHVRNPHPSVSQKQLEDPLEYLPYSTILEYRKGQLIYSQDEAATNLFLVVAGRVKVSRVTDNGKQVVVDIYQTDEFFGESGFLSSQKYGDQATAIEQTRLMTWSMSAVEDHMLKRPRLGFALLQVLIEHAGEFKARIESFALDTVEIRLERAMVRLSERFGVVEDNGNVSMSPLTHELLAQYVGTSREIITHYMTKMRSQGKLKYSRRGITLIANHRTNRWGRPRSCKLSGKQMQNADQSARFPRTHPLSSA